jgi:dTDP-4-dehydrorhamnose reductase
MSILVLGSGGQIGSELMRTFRRDGVSITGLTHAQLDIANRGAVETAIAASRPDLVVNTAAYTAVDRAESDRNVALRVNRDGPAFVAEACTRVGAALIHLSTDYVFDGNARTPYKEDAAPAPVSVYGHSKVEGEIAVRARLENHIILRTAWVYGLEGRNFMKTMLELAQSRSELRVVSDRWGSPTSAREIAHAIAAMARRMSTGDALWGTYHFAGAGVTSWHGYAEAIFEFAARSGLSRPHVIPIASSDYPAAARRPAYSALDCAKITRNFGLEPRPWRDALEEMLACYLDQRLRSGEAAFCRSS